MGSLWACSQAGVGFAFLDAGSNGQFVRVWACPFYMSTYMKNTFTSLSYEFASIFLLVVKYVHIN